MATKHNTNCMKTSISLKSVFVLAIVLLATSCHESEGMRSHADLQTMPPDQMIARVMAYVQAHEQQIDFLTERNFSSKDMKVRHAMYQQSKDTAWVLIPIVRTLRDSMATADSLYFAPRRLFALSLITQGCARPRLWFVEQDPTREFHKANRTAFFYRHFTGRQDTYSEKGNKVNTVKLHGGKLVLTRISETDSTDIIDNGSLDEVVVTAPWKYKFGYGDLCEPWGRLFSDGGDDIGGIGEGGGTSGGGTSGGGTSGGGTSGEKVKDCNDSEMAQAKVQAQQIHGMLLRATTFDINGNAYVSMDVFKEIANSKEGSEYNSFLRDYTEDGYGYGLTYPSTKNMPHKGSSFHLINSISERASIHNHSNEMPMSAVDIMELIRVRTIDGCPNFSTMVVWDNKNNVYYYATITDEEKAKFFYENYNQYVDEETGYWKQGAGNGKENNVIGTFLDKMEDSFEKYSKEDRHFYETIAVLDKFNAGITLVKVDTGLDAGNNEEYYFTSYGSYLVEKKKYITIKYCP